MTRCRRLRLRLARGRAGSIGRPPRRCSRASAHRLHAVARLIRRRFERRVRQAGLPITRLQASLLIRIARNPGLSQTAAATELDIEPIALVRMLDRLHEEGFVERRAHPTDRRVWTLWLLPLAWPVVRAHPRNQPGNPRGACAGLSPAARDTLLDALNHMKGNLAIEDEEVL